MFERVSFVPVLFTLAVNSAQGRELIDCDFEQPENLTQSCPAGNTHRASDFSKCVEPALFKEAGCLILDKSIQFCANTVKTANVTVLLNSSDVTFDCSGVTIDHKLYTRSEAARQGIRSVKNRSLKNVTIKNCAIQNTAHMGIDLGRRFSGQLKANSLPIGHRNILIENISIKNVHTGIFIGPYSSSITLSRVRTDMTQRIAVYSEAGTHQLNIRHSEFRRNQTRESIALDSTYDSTIEHSFFYDNKEGAISSYTNCGELRGIVCPVLRSTPANNNQIHGNVFAGNGQFSINIAARQGRRHRAGWCATLDGKAGRHLDESRHNIIFANDIRCTSGKGIRILDGPNFILDNVVNAYNSCEPLEIGSGDWWISKNYLLKNSVISHNRLRKQHREFTPDIPVGVTLKNGF